MPKTLAWLGGSTMATVVATVTHGPLLVVLVIAAAVMLAAVVTTYVAAVFFTAPRKNLVALIRRGDGRAVDLDSARGPRVSIV